MVFSSPAERINVNAIVQDGDSSSFHDATETSSINSSLSEMETEGPAITFTEPTDTFIVGEIVSFCGSGSTGVTGVGGSGSGSGPGSGSPQDRRLVNARNQANSLMSTQVIVYLTITLTGISSRNPFHWSSTKNIRPSIVSPGL